MPTIKQNFGSTVDSSIAQKTVDFSVAKTDVSNRFVELVNLLGATLANTSLSYTKGWFVFTNAPFGIYCAIQEGVSGDTTILTNWVKIGGGGMPYLVSGIDLIDSILSYQPANYSVNYPVNLNIDAGKIIPLRFHGVASSNTSQINYNVIMTTSGASDGTSVIIKLDNNGYGMSTLVIDSTNTERLAFGSTYLFTKTSDATGYILTKLCSEGIRAVTINLLYSSPGKYIIALGQQVILPLAVGLYGQSVDFYLTTGGTGALNLTASGSDTIVNMGAYAYTLPLMRFTSDGVNKWYYTT